MCLFYLPVRKFFRTSAFGNVWWWCLTVAGLRRDSQQVSYSTSSCLLEFWIQTVKKAIIVRYLKLIERPPMWRVAANKLNKQSHKGVFIGQGPLRQQRGMDWIGLDRDRDRWRTLVSAVMNLRVPWNAGNFLTSCKPVSCSRRTLHRGVSK